MLPRDRRVRTPAEFRHLRRAGVRVGRRTVVVSVAPDPAHAESPSSEGPVDQQQAAPTRPASSSTPRRPRAGFVVSKAVGNAVTRNRVKRRLRDVVRQEMATPALRDAPVLIQVRALPAAAEADHAELRRDVAGALAKALKGVRRTGAAETAR